VIVFPAVAVGVSGLFAVQLFSQYARRKRLSQLAWGIAMTMFALASLAVAAGTTGGWDPTLYRIYWLFGALLNVPYLALGSVALLGRRAFTALVLVAVVAATAIGVIVVASASVNLAEATKQIPRGSAVWGKGTLAAKLPTFMSIPAYVIVVVIAVATGRSRRLPSFRVRANWLIAIGATIVAIGGPLARYGRGSVFSVTLAVGVTVMFLGFRLAARRSPDAAVKGPQLADGV
jgi:hypothetical protein